MCMYVLTENLRFWFAMISCRENVTHLQHDKISEIWQAIWQALLRALSLGIPTLRPSIRGSSKLHNIGTVALEIRQPDTLRQCSSTMFHMVATWYPPFIHHEISGVCHMSWYSLYEWRWDSQHDWNCVVNLVLCNFTSLCVRQWRIPTKPGQLTNSQRSLAFPASTPLAWRVACMATWITANAKVRMTGLFTGTCFRDLGDKNGVNPQKKHINYKPKERYRK